MPAEPPMESGLFSAAGGFALATVLRLYLNRSTHCFLDHYGASPEELPRGKAIVPLNPLRNRKGEANAEWLIGDLRTDEREEIARGRLSTDPTRVGPVTRGVYVVYIGVDETGWGVKTASIVR